MTKPYEAKFDVGKSVRIQSRDALEQFKREWKYHNPLTDQQLSYAGSLSHVKEVGFYHGGDALYTLDDVPGVWHEQNLSPG
jgi:hypothetical protein